MDFSKPTLTLPTYLIVYLTLVTLVQICRFSLFYDMYTRFQHSYYHRHDSGPLLSPEQFKTKAPLFVIDCSRQDESLKSSAVDIRLEFESSSNFPANTTAYALIIHDTIVQYTPLTNTVHRVT